MSLNPKQQCFVDEYLKDFNGKQAAIRAGYSPKTAEVQASRLLTVVKVREAVESRRTALTEKAGVTVERIIEEYARLAFLDPAEAFDKEGKLIPVCDMPEDVRRAVGGLDVVEMAGGMKVDSDGASHVPMYTKKLKFWDKKGALDSLAKIKGMFVEKVEHTGKDGGPIQTKEVTDMELALWMRRTLLRAGAAG